MRSIASFHIKHANKIHLCFLPSVVIHSQSVLLTQKVEKLTALTLANVHHPVTQKLNTCLL